MPHCGYANAIFHDANFPCKDVNVKFIHDDANTPLRRCKCKWHLVGYHDANAFYLTQIQFNQKFFYFQIEAFSEPGTKMLSKLDLFFFLIILVRLECPMHHSCNKNMFYFDLKLPKNSDHY